MTAEGIILIKMFSKGPRRFSVANEQDCYGCVTVRFWCQCGMHCVASFFS